jgi:DNA-directed RNA polymerase specialized sigma24 family protein
VSFRGCKGAISLTKSKETVLRDRPYADVAAELGVTPGTLRTRVHYGLRRLRCVLETADTAA